MPWVEKLPSGKFRGFWRDTQGRKRSRSGFTQRAQALRFAAEQEARARRGDRLDDQGRAPKWEDWAEVWWARRVVEASTAAQDERRLKRYLEPKWTGVRLNRVQRGDVQAWVNELAKTARDDGDRALSPASVDRIYRLFSASMKAAMLDGLIGSTPCVGINLPTAAPGHERYLTRGELDLILYHLPAHYRPAVTLLAYTGLRFGELAGLHWQRVDMGAERIDVVETWDPTEGVIKGYPKGKAQRAVPIVSQAQEALGVLLDRMETEPTSCGLTHKATTRCRSGLVVPGPRGGPLDGRNFGKRAWADAVDRAGIGHVRLHDLRHTFASWLVQDGVPLQEVQRLLGHSSIVTTQRYAHLGTSQNELVRRALEGHDD